MEIRTLLKILLSFELIVIHEVTLVEGGRLLVIKLFILVVHLIELRHFNLKIPTFVSLSLLIEGLVVEVCHLLSLIGLKLLCFVSIVFGVFSLIHFTRSTLALMISILVELSLLLTTIHMIIDLFLRYILILLNWRWRRWIIRKWHLIFIVILPRSVHDAIKLLIKLLLLEIHGMENFLSTLLLVIIHVHRVMMRSMVSLKEMRFLWVSNQSTSKHLPSFVQVLPHLPSFIFKSFNFVE